MEPAQETEIEFTLSPDAGKALLDLLAEKDIQANHKTIRSFDGDEAMWKIIITSGGHLAKKLIDGLQGLIAKLFKSKASEERANDESSSTDDSEEVSFTITNGKTTLKVENAPVSELRYAIEQIGTEK